MLGVRRSWRSETWLAALATSLAVACAPAGPARVPAATPPLSAAQLAGEHVIYSYAGATPPAELIALIRRGEAAGVIFFAPNVTTVAHTRAVVAELQRANAQSPVHAPLLMLTDQEGGLVRRLPGEPTLSEKQLGRSPDPRAGAARAGAGAARSLRGAGMNVNLAPVLDVYRSSGDFIDRYQRSYGHDPGLVAKLGAAFVAAQQGRRVAATAKHFPGLGAARAGQDTDAGPVELSQPLSQLRADDEAPYTAAVRAGVRLVMLSWAVYPALDARRPAGMSPAVIGGELRARRHFRGVTITDALGAGALHAFGGFGSRAVAATGAGADLLLCSVPNVANNTVRNGTSARDALVRALSQGKLSAAALRQSAARVVALRSSL